MQNYHRHTSYSNISTPDSAATNEEYAKRAVELGRKVLCSVEHGWCGYYFQTYELAKKYNLKCVIGAEAYWVKDRLAEFENGVNKKGEKTYVKDKSNHHIILLAKNNKGREAINDIISEANITGYYYKPRVDLDLLLSLPSEDVFVTSACIAFSGYEDTEDIIFKLHKHFKDNFALEIQYHNTEKQKEWNKQLLDYSQKYGIDLIVGLDSHYVYGNEAWKRDIILEAKGVRYEDEIGWYMDEPDDETIINRFLEQGIFSREQIQKAMNKTDICLTFDDYDDVPIFNKDIKLPTLYPGKTKEEKDKIYSRLITQKFKEYTKDFSEEERARYFEGIKAEVQTYKDTGMSDYPLIDYAIVKDAVEHGGLITSTGRGSAVGFMTNTLCGFSKVDRFKSDIKLYPERFISTTRILETHSLPDIDLNVGTVDIFEEAQKRVLGDNHAVPMIAFGTLKKKSAFKIYAKAKGLNFDLANNISAQLDKYDEAVKYADDEDRDEISVYDYVDEEYKEYIEQSEEYWGIISDKKKAPSAYLLYQGDIRKEIGLIKCKSESTNKEYITCVIDGAIAENYKFLKNDILKVDSVLLIDKVFKRIGIESFDVNTLLEKTKDNQKVWDIYSNGYTIGVNQVEKDGSRKKCMIYKPHNISELSAFVAAIRPGFKSMYKMFESREDFRWGIDVLDNLLRTKELPVSFLFFQEQVMSVLNYAGFPMGECYGIIKAIAKKHPEKVKPLKSRFIEGFKNKIIEDEKLTEDVAIDYSERVWQIINDNCGYGFNSAHACCMALDSLYQAWQKAIYPYEFYEVCLQHFSDKGKKDKVSALKAEMRKAFGISEGRYKFRNDNTVFKADPDNKVIYPALSSIKGLSNADAKKLYELKDNYYSNFFELLLDLKKIKFCSSLSDKMTTLIKINYFEEFGDINTLLKITQIFFDLYGRKEFSKNNLPFPEYLAEKYAVKITPKQYTFSDNNMDLIIDYCNSKNYPKTTLIDKLTYETEHLGYIQLTVPSLSEEYYYVQSIDNNWVTLYQLKTGLTNKIKFRKNKNYYNNQFNNCAMLKLTDNSIQPQHKYRPVRDLQGNILKDDKGKNVYEQIDEMEDILTEWILIV